MPEDDLLLEIEKELGALYEQLKNQCFEFEFDINKQNFLEASLRFFSLSQAINDFIPPLLRGNREIVSISKNTDERKKKQLELLRRVYKEMEAVSPLVWPIHAVPYPILFLREYLRCYELGSLNTLSDFFTILQDEEVKVIYLEENLPTVPMEEEMMIAPFLMRSMVQDNPSDLEGLTLNVQLNDEDTYLFQEGFFQNSDNVTLLPQTDFQLACYETRSAREWLEEVLLERFQDTYLLYGKELFCLRSFLNINEVNLPEFVRRLRAKIHYLKHNQSDLYDALIKLFCVNRVNTFFSVEEQSAALLSDEGLENRFFQALPLLDLGNFRKTEVDFTFNKHPQLQLYLRKFLSISIDPHNIQYYEACLRLLSQSGFSLKLVSEIVFALMQEFSDHPQGLPRSLVEELLENWQSSLAYFPSQAWGYSLKQTLEKWVALEERGMLNNQSKQALISDMIVPENQGVWQSQIGLLTDDEYVHFILMLYPLYLERFWQEKPFLSVLSERWNSILLERVFEKITLETFSSLTMHGVDFFSNRKGWVKAFQIMLKRNVIDAYFLNYIEGMVKGNKLNRSTQEELCSTHIESVVFSLYFPAISLQIALHRIFAYICASNEGTISNTNYPRLRFMLGTALYSAFQTALICYGNKVINDRLSFFCSLILDTVPANQKFDDLNRAIAIIRLFSIISGYYQSSKKEKIIRNFLARFNSQFTAEVVKSSLAQLPPDAMIDCLSEMEKKEDFKKFFSSVKDLMEFSDYFFMKDGRRLLGLRKTPHFSSFNDYVCFSDLFSHLLDRNPYLVTAYTQLIGYAISEHNLSPESFLSSQYFVSASDLTPFIDALVLFSKSRDSQALIKACSERYPNKIRLDCKATFPFLLEKLSGIDELCERISKSAPAHFDISMIGKIYEYVHRNGSDFKLKDFGEKIKPILSSGVTDRVHDKGFYLAISLIKDEAYLKFFIDRFFQYPINQQDSKLLEFFSVFIKSDYQKIREKEINDNVAKKLLDYRGGFWDQIFTRFSLLKSLIFDLDPVYYKEFREAFETSVCAELNDSSAVIKFLLSPVFSKNRLHNGLIENVIFRIFPRAADLIISHFKTEKLTESTVRKEKMQASVSFLEPFIWFSFPTYELYLNFLRRAFSIDRLDTVRDRQRFVAFREVYKLEGVLDKKASMSNEDAPSRLPAASQASNLLQPFTVFGSTVPAGLIEPSPSRKRPSLENTTSSARRIQH